MKLISVKVGVVFFIFGFIIFCNLEVSGADWRHYGTTEDTGQFFYDQDSITFLPEGIVRVWERTIKDEDLKKAIEEKKGATQKFIEGKLSGKKSVSKEEIEKMYEEWRKEFLRNLVITEKRMLIELKCGENMFRLISGIEYDEKGNAKKGFSASQPEWLRIAPEAPIEGLYNTVCPKSK
jgi:Surface-adhesin protein E